MVEDEVVKLLSSTTLEDYKKLATLGMGGFGRVELVRERERGRSIIITTCGV